MNETLLIKDIEVALQDSPARKVIYLEGTTDLAMLFGLLGVPVPTDGLHNGVLVRGLKDDKSGTGGTSVRARVELAAAKGYRGIYGVIDGDGRSLAELSASFDPPFSGPLFTWKGYCLENLIVKTGWPAAWGAPPDWEQALLDHAPYVALNRIFLDIKEKLTTLRLTRFSYPILREPRKTVQDVAEALERDKHLLGGYDVAARFAHEVESFHRTVTSSLDEGHALVNGKWLVDVYAPGRLGPSFTPPACREAWIAHAASVGGLSEVRALWERITGHAP